MRPRKFRWIEAPAAEAAGCSMRRPCGWRSDESLGPRTPPLRRVALDDGTHPLPARAGRTRGARDHRSCRLLPCLPPPSGEHPLGCIGIESIDERLPTRRTLRGRCLLLALFTSGARRARFEKCVASGHCVLPRSSRSQVDGYWRRAFLGSRPCAERAAPGRSHAVPQILRTRRVSMSSRRMT